MRLGILTQNDTVGLQEVVDRMPRRLVTVQCVTNEGQAYFLKKEIFFQIFHQSKFMRQILEERHLKLENYVNRMVETFEF